MSMPRDPLHSSVQNAKKLRRKHLSAGCFVTVDVFVKALRALVVEDQVPQVIKTRRVSETPAFPYSRPTLTATKPVFNFVACDNEFEKRFARFLQDALTLSVSRKCRHSSVSRSSIPTVSQAFVTTSPIMLLYSTMGRTDSSRRKGERIPTYNTRTARRTYGARTRRRERG
jgi:hypothetical protein